MKKSIIALAVVSTIGLAASAQAQGFVGIGGGITNLSVDCTGAATCDKTGNGFRLNGGWMFSPNLGAEIAYYDFGKAKASGPVFGVNVGGDWKTTAFGAGLVYGGPLAPNWTGAVRLGIANVKAKITATAQGVSASDSESKTKPYYGIEAGYEFSKSTAINLFADFSTSEFGGEKGNVRLIGVGLKFSF